MNKTFAFILMLFFVSTVHAELMPPTVGQCEYYLQMEQEKQCGVEGYLLDYGHKYCQKFVYQKKSKFSDKGRPFVDSASLCLQKSLWNHSELNCKDLATAAINSHTSCYLTAGFCDLSFHDKMVILSTIKKELIHRTFRKQAYKMMKICRAVKRFDGR